MTDKRTYADRAETIKKAVIKRRRRIRQQAVEYKGGKCIICGYKTWIGALEFHHPNPKKKEFAVSKDGNTRSWARVKEEIKKCVLVCSNCHREVHDGVTQLPMETSVEK